VAASQDKRIERQDIDFTCGELWYPVNLPFISVNINSEVLAFNKASAPKFIKPFGPIWRGQRRANCPPKSGHLRRRRAPALAEQLFDARWLC
jgi:hypothetical protein